MERELSVPTVGGSLERGMDTTQEQALSSACAALSFLSAFFTILRYNFLPPSL